MLDPILNVIFDKYDDSDLFSYLNSLGEWEAYRIHRIVFEDGRETLYYAMRADGEPTTPAMPAIAMIAVLEARTARVQEYLKTLH